MKIAIIGAGMSGLGMARALKKAGFEEITLYEKDAGLGGTWFKNTYPGSGCDVPSHLYSYSFALNPHWSRKWAEQKEILAYFESFADKNDLRRHIVFNTAITKATFDAKSSCWTLRTSQGKRLVADILIAGTGQLSTPYIPDIPGLKNFQGTVFHSAQWNHDVNLKNKHVVSVGNGASAVQFVPRIAPLVKKLSIVQRAPNWIVPKLDRPFKAWEKKLFALVPLTMRIYRAFIYWQLEARFFSFRQHKGKKPFIAWEKLARGLSVKYLHSVIKDAKLRQKLTPNYPVGCKRILISSDYYQTLLKDNVHVVTDSIKAITPTGVELRHGKSIKADVLILATGFRATDFITPVVIQGLQGKRLHQVWKGGASAYKGITVAGFPNFYMLYGPNTNLGHNSIIFMVECQVRYIMKCIKALRQGRFRTMSIKKTVMKKYNTAINKSLKQTVWAGACESWYKTKDGKITNNWPSWTVRYYLETRKVNLKAFDKKK